MSSEPLLVGVVPAAGVGARMKADSPKQYLLIEGEPILKLSVQRLLNHPLIAAVVIAVSDSDPYISEIEWSCEKPVFIVSGGKERADSVLAGVNAALAQFSADWVLVHDAARPCLRHSDLSQLISQVMADPSSRGGILAAPVRDTMKRQQTSIAEPETSIEQTVERQGLWHAQTPQMFKAEALKCCLESALEAGVHVTDEASAMEHFGHHPLLIEGHADNIKVTHPEDLILAKFFIQQELT